MSHCCQETGGGGGEGGRGGGKRDRVLSGCSKNSGERRLGMERPHPANHRSRRMEEGAIVALGSGVRRGRGCQAAALP